MQQLSVGPLLVPRTLHIHGCKRFQSYVHEISNCATEKVAEAPDGRPRLLQTSGSPWKKGSSHRPCPSATAAASPLPRPGTDRCSHRFLSRCPSSGRPAAPLVAGPTLALLMLHLCRVTAVLDEREEEGVYGAEVAHSLAYTV